jgi:hypothetical protein
MESFAILTGREAGGKGHCVGLPVVEILHEPITAWSLLARFVDLYPLGSRGGVGSAVVFGTVGDVCHEGADFVGPVPSFARSPLREGQ